MIKIAIAQMWVHDQDEALVFYTEKLGWRSAPTSRSRSWATSLVVGHSGRTAGHRDRLMAIPEPPMFDSETAQQIRDVMAEAWPARCCWRRTTARPATRSSGRAESSSPRRRSSVPYEIDSSLRDPSGNSIRLTQVSEMATA